MPTTSNRCTKDRAPGREKTYVFSKDFPGLGWIVTPGPPESFGRLAPAARLGSLAARGPVVRPDLLVPLGPEEVVPSAYVATTLSNVIFLTRNPPSTASFSASILGLGALGRDGPGTGSAGIGAPGAGFGGGTTVAGLEVNAQGNGFGAGLFADMAVENASLSASLMAFGIDCFTLAAPGLETLTLGALAFISYEMGAKWL